MSKLVQFPTKGSLREVPTVKNPFGKPLTISKLDDYGNLDQQYRDYDFRGSLERFPEVGVGTRRDKFFVLNERFPICNLVAGALFAKSVSRDIDAHNQLLKMFQYLKQEGYKTIPAKILPPELVGYVVNLVEDRVDRNAGVPTNFHKLHLPYFGSFIVAGWNGVADSERASLKNKASK